MITHIFMLKLADGATDDQVQHFADGLDELVPQLDMIRGYRHGRDVGIRDDTWDYAVVADFDSVEDYLAYASHPLHIELGVNRSRPIIGESVRVQIET